jgi:UDP-glucose 6-dehydrogenase
VKISVIGTGYVGLVTGSCLAEIGHEVVCTDNDAAKIRVLESGGVPIYEPGLDSVIAKARKAGRLSFSGKPADSASGDAIFICVGTPPLPNGDADLSAIDHVARTIAGESRSPKLVIEKAFVRLAERSGVDFSMLTEAEKVNHRRIDRFFEKIRRALWVVKGKQIGVLGLAFKPNTDDVRFAPAIELIRRLLEAGAVVRAYDPEAMDKARSILPQIEYVKSPYEAAKGVEALLIATEWPQFRQLDWHRVRDAISRPLIIDGRNLIVPSEMKAAGFEYYSFGRPD